MPVQPQVFQKELVLFYSSGSHWCQRVVGDEDKPWEQLERTYHGDPSIKIRKINEDELSRMPLYEKIRYRQPNHPNFLIEGLPTILLVDESGVHVYEGSRSLKSLQLFLNARDYYKKMMKLKALVESSGSQTNTSDWSLQMRCACRDLYSQFDL